jgi:ubiquinone biosynthesis protein COQ9
MTPPEATETPRSDEGAGEFQEGDHLDAAREALLDAALPHVAFDGWSDKTLRRAAEEEGMDAGLARVVFPRGGADAALAFHERGDRQLAEALATARVEDMRMRDRVAFGVRRRIELVARHREAVRRGGALLALPPYAADGARAIWRTADVIWTGCGDASRDGNWWTKRAILAAVYSSTALFWLGDESEGSAESWAFLDRRIDEVMRFEKAKASVNANPLGRLMMTGPNLLMRAIRAPRSAAGRGA